MDIHEVQEFIRTAPIEDVRDVLTWGRGVIEMREEFAVKKARAPRSDKGKTRKSDNGTLPLE